MPTDFPLGWVKSRLLKQPYALWTPLDPLTAGQRLQWALESSAANTLLGLEPDTPFRGSLNGPHVTLRGRLSRRRRAGGWQFDGVIQPSQPGSWLVGGVGPPTVVQILHIGFLLVFGPMLLVGLMSALAQMGDGGGARLLLGPLIPGVFVAAAVAASEQQVRLRRRVWADIDRWLRDTLEVPAPSAGPRY